MKNEEKADKQIVYFDWVFSLNFAHDAQS